MIVVSDSGPLISLMKVEQLYLLHKLYGEILIPEAVYSELTTNIKYKDEAEIINKSSFIRVVYVKERKAVEILQRVSGLDLGESEAIIYADIVLMEEEAGRIIAKSMGLRVRGSIGILLLGFDKKIVSSDDVMLAINKMKSANRRISDKLYLFAQDYVRKQE